MRAVAITAYGDADQLQVMNLPIPEPGKGEVLVRIKAAGVNMVDTFFREGFLGKSKFPLVMGSDFSGVIEKLGAEVTGLSVGDEVYGYKYLGDGTYAEYASVPAALLAKKSPTLSFEEAAALPCAGLIAYDVIVNVLRLQAGETLLITGASGGVGMVGIQVAKSLGVRVMATAGPENQNFLRELGADEAIDYTKGDYVAAVRKLHPDGVDAALSAAATTVQTVAGTVRDHGRLSWITGPDGPKMERMIAGTFTNGSRGTALLDGLTALVDAGKLPIIHIDKTYDLTTAAEAQEEVRSGHVKGKLVIVV